MVAPPDVEVIDVHSPLLMLYSMVFVRPLKAFQQIVPSVRILKVR